MKFVNPELEVVMFSFEDVLTTSGTEGPTETISVAESMMEGECTGRAYDWNFEPDCI